MELSWNNYGYNMLFLGNMAEKSKKREIRLKVDSKFYQLLAMHAGQYGVKINEYIVHVLLNDFQSGEVEYLDAETEANLAEAYKEIEETKANGTYHPMTAKEVMKMIRNS